MASAASSSDETWRANLVNDTDEVYKIALEAKNIAVLGIKTEAQAPQPAFHVAAYLNTVGKNIIPLPVYYPEVTEILGKKVYRKVSEVPEPIDILDVFRRSQDVPGHVEDILNAPNRPKCVWLQSHITHPESEEKLARAGIKVISDRCLMVEHKSAVMDKQLSSKL